MRDKLFSLKNKEFIYQCLIILINQQRKDDIEKLINPDYCKDRFDMNYAILQEVPLYGSIPDKDFLDHCGYRRYYSQPVTAFGKRYIVCNDWYYNAEINKRDTRTDFVEWIINI